MSALRVAPLLLTFVFTVGHASATVVINEILYHAPDDLDDLQFIELYNTGNADVDLSGWKLNRDVKFEFPRGTKIAANGYLVLCKNPALFKRYYGFAAAGTFTGSLDRGRGHVELVNAAGNKIDSVRYRSRAPWPLAAAGYSSSLERICPTAPAEGPENWAPSPLPAAGHKPGGTPGAKNTSFAAHLPPVIRNVTFTPTHALPDQEVRVEAEARSAEELKAVELRYRVAGSGFEKAEVTVPMTKAASGKYTASIPGQKPGQILRFRVRAVDASNGERFAPYAQDLRPAFSVYVHDKFPQAKIPLGYIVNVGGGGGAGRGGIRFFNFGGGPGAALPPRGKSAFVYVSAKTGEAELFDFINVTPRKAGHKVRLHKDHTLDGMTTLNLIYEFMDRFVFAEPMAFEVYRKAGNAACRTDFVRTWIDGRPIGFQLLIEQPNSAFVRHNKLHGGGNLYKCQWFGNGVVGTHEKKTHIHEGHDDIVQLVDQLNRTKGDEQWKVIKKNFDVEQVATYFAVNMVLSHWDGYFNNYFTYHDTRGGGKWTMYPWDQDKTWGFHDGIGGYDIFFDMPLTFGMEGDVPPGWPKNQMVPQGIGIGAIWWRHGGYFSKPLLANPQFRKLFLARTKELLEKVYTEEVMFPLIKGLQERLEDEVKFRAQLQGQDGKQAVEHFHRNLDTLRTHLKKRRQFLLAQEEIKKAGAFDRAALKD
jgi:hypothetical protein